jgi:hypothetical protein
VLDIKKPNPPEGGNDKQGEVNFPQQVPTAKKSQNTQHQDDPPVGQKSAQNLRFFSRRTGKSVQNNKKKPGGKEEEKDGIPINPVQEPEVKRTGLILLQSKGPDIPDTSVIQLTVAGMVDAMGFPPVPKGSKGQNPEYRTHDGISPLIWQIGTMGTIMEKNKHSHLEHSQQDREGEIDNKGYSQSY